ncbi:hypothetical protein ACVR1I_08835 [Streptococcus cameli]
MTKRNELLEKDISEKISNARYVKPEKKNNRRPIFYLTVVLLVTISVVFSLMRYFR